MSAVIVRGLCRSSGYRVALKSPSISMIFAGCCLRTAVMYSDTRGLILGPSCGLGGQYTLRISMSGDLGRVIAAWVTNPFKWGGTCCIARRPKAKNSFLMASSVPALAGVTSGSSEETTRYPGNRFKSHWALCCLGWSFVSTSARISGGVSVRM